jgi:hypothetical protein
MTRKRSFLPFSFYLLITISNPVFYNTWLGSISVFCIFLFFFFLFNSFQHYYPQLNALNIALALTLGSFVWQPLLFFFPVLWLGLSRFHSLNFRSFFASIVGFAVIYLFVLAGSIYVGNNADFFIEKLPDFRILFQFHPFKGFDIWEYIVFGYLFLLFIISGMNIFMTNISETAKTMTTLSFLYITAFIIFVILFLQPQWKNEWASILCLPLSVLIPHLFSIFHKKTICWLMLISILFFIGISVFRNIKIGLF